MQKKHCLFYLILDTLTSAASSQTRQVVLPPTFRSLPLASIPTSIKFINTRSSFQPTQIYDDSSRKSLTILKWLLYKSALSNQPIHQSPHLANDSLNVANCFFLSISKKFHCFEQNPIDFTLLWV